MKDITELLKHIIAHETKYVESMRHSLKEDGLTILRLQNKSRALEKEIEERKQLILEYRSYLRNVSEMAQVGMKLMPSKQHIDTDSSVTQITLVKNLEKQA